MKKHKIAVYGSLREGMYNRRGFNTLKTTGNHRISGYKMRSLGGYPYIYPSERGSVVVELCEVENDDYNSIRMMELGAGYEEVTETIGGVDYIIYVYNRDDDRHDLIVDGDWVKYKS